QSWMFISSYDKLRYDIINNNKIESLLHLGLAVFKELNTKIVQSVSYILRKSRKINGEGTYFDLRNGKDLFEKERLFLERKNKYIQIQNQFLKIPNYTIAYWANNNVFNVFKNKKISDYSNIFQGMITGNNSKFVRFWFEINENKLSLNNSEYKHGNYKEKYWCPYNKGGESIKWYGNQKYVVNFQNEGKNFTRGRYQFKELFFKEYVTWSYISLSLVARYFPKGFLWDVAGSGLFPYNSENIYYIVSLLTSKAGNFLLGILNPTLNYQVENIASVPLIFPDNNLFNKINTLTKSCIEISKTIYDNNEISLNFERLPLINYDSFLKKSYYEWEKMSKYYFLKLHQNEEELNRIFIDIYGFHKEISQKISFKKITIFQEEIDTGKLNNFENEYRTTGQLDKLPIKKDIVMSQLLSYMVGCMMGRYCLDKPGLIMANQGESLNEALQNHEINEQSFPIDEDGIVSFNGSNAYFADDASHRVKAFLIAVWGEDTLTENINFLNECLGMDYEKWLTEKFWEFHCRMYKKTPIYWMFASNPKKPQRAAFKVLAYMHRMNKFTVQNIRNKYLHPYIQWLRDELENLEKNKDNLNKEQLKRMEKLDEDKKECIEYDDVLKKLANQQIEFDLDDGVKHNIAKFEGAVAEIK
ncbi:MAG: BREX-1 system adenine-specific DNA-methyltransferase PglX, partial [bacterium]